MWQYSSEFLSLMAVHILAVMSPGPDFAVIVRQSVTHGRKAGVWTSLGIGTGILFHLSYTLLGVGVFLSKNELAFSLVKGVGAAYLTYIGIKLIYSARHPKSQINEETAPTKTEMRIRGSGRPKKAFRLGALTNLFNPKVTLFFLSLFSVFVSPKTPIMVQSFYGAAICITTVLWFVLVSYLFAQKSVRQRFLNFGHWFDRIMGVVLVVLAVELALSGMS